MMRLCASLFFLATVASFARADTAVVFDFEAQSAGPALPNTVLTDAGTGLKITISRSITFPAPQIAPFSFVNLTPFGLPAFGMSLSPFDNPTAAVPFVIDIDTSGLLPAYAGMFVNRIDWTMGDFIPSDQDILTVMTMAGGVPHSATIGIPFDLSLGYFGFASGFASRSNAGIDQLRIMGGSPDFPNSLYFGGFTFNLSHAVAGSDLPESSAGGDPTTDSANGAGGAPAPVPEPATVLLAGLGAVALAVRRRRR